MPLIRQEFGAIGRCVAGALLATGDASRGSEMVELARPTTVSTSRHETLAELPEEYWDTQSIRFSGHSLVVDPLTGGLSVSYLDEDQSFWGLPVSLGRSWSSHEANRLEDVRRRRPNALHVRHLFGNWSSSLEASIETSAFEFAPSARLASAGWTGELIDPPAGPADTNDYLSWLGFDRARGSQLGLEVRSTDQFLFGPGANPFFVVWRLSRAAAFEHQPHECWVYDPSTGTAASFASPGDGAVAGMRLSAVTDVDRREVRVRADLAGLELFCGQSSTFTWSTKSVPFDPSLSTHGTVRLVIACRQSVAASAENLYVYDDQARLASVTMHAGEAEERRYEYRYNEWSGLEEIRDSDEAVLRINWTYASTHESLGFRHKVSSVGVESDSVDFEYGADNITGTARWAPTATHTVHGRKHRPLSSRTTTERATEAVDDQALEAAWVFGPAPELHLEEFADGDTDSVRTFRDDYGRPTRMVRSNRLETRFTYADPSGRPGPHADLVEVTKFSLNPEVELSRQVASYEVDQAGVSTHRLASVIDANGHETTFRRSPDGRRIAEQLEIGSPVISHLDDRGRPVEVVRGDGTWERFSHDELGRLTLHSDNGVETAYEFSGGTSVLSKVLDDSGGPRSLRSLYTYSSAGRLTGLTERASLPLSIQRAPSGRIARIDRSPVGDSVSIAYGVTGRPVRIDFDDNTRAEFRWSPSGRILSYSHRGDSVPILVTYGSDGTPREFRSGAELITQYDVDDLGQPVEILTLVDGAIRSRRVQWDSLGRLRSSSVGADEVERYEYDRIGNITRSRMSTVDVDLTYDSAHMITGLTAITQGVALAFTRAASTGSVEQIVTRSATTSLELDLQYVPAGEAQGELRTAVVRGATIQHSYDRLGRVIATQVSDPTSADSFGWQWSYDDEGRLETERTTGLGRAERRFSYAGDRLASDTAFGDYAHDPSGRLVEASGQNAVRFSIGLDRRIVGGSNVPTPIRYDSYGNVVGFPTETGEVALKVGSDGELITVSAPNGSESSFEYSSSGSLITVTTGGEVTRLVYGDSDLPIIVTNERSSVQMLRHPDSGVPLAFIAAGPTGTIDGPVVTDPSGKILACLTSSNGNLTPAFIDQRDAWGVGPFEALDPALDAELLALLGDGVGPIHLASGIRFGRARWYSPNLRSWLSRDPIEDHVETLADIDDVVEIVEDPYAYLTDPLNSRDPSGLGKGKLIIYGIKFVRTTTKGGRVITQTRKTGKISKSKAVKLRQQGKDILVQGGTRKQRKRFTKEVNRAANGRGKQPHHTLHHNKAPHYHSVDVKGHAFYRLAAVFSLPENYPDSTTAEVVDLVNPFSIPKDALDIANYVFYGVEPD